MNSNIQNKIFKVEKFNNQGKGIVKDNGKVIFISYAVPDDKVKINIIKEKKNYNVGEVVEYIEKSSKHTIPMCPYFYKCGGCQLMNISYKDTLNFKENNVKEILTSYGIKTNYNKIISGNDLFYRNKITLKVKQGKLGLYKENSHELIPIDKCLLCDQEINRTITKLQKMDLHGVDEIIIKTNGDYTLVVLCSSNKINNNKLEELEVDSIVMKKNKSYDLLVGEGAIYYQIGNFKYKSIASSFFQVNKYLTKELYDKVLEYLNPHKEDKVLDLFCGSGTIGIYIANKVKEVTGVELDANSIKSANYNKKINNINNIKFIQNDVSKVIDKLTDTNKIIVDPPRSGLTTTTINTIKKIGPQTIVYVSCNPETLGRDLKSFSSMYDINEVSLIDMFPYTYHVECVCVLKLR